MTGAPRCLVLLVVALAVLPLAAQQPSFSTRRETVRVDVLVTDRGRPLRDLRAEDFEVLDSGVPQQVEFARFEELPLAIVLALDVSASVSPEGLDHLRGAGRLVIDNLKAGDQAALLTFTDALTLRERLTPDTASLKAALDGMQPSKQLFGGTSLIDASYAAITLLAQDGGRGLVIAFTDGIDTSSWLPSGGVIDTARRANAVVYAVSMSTIPRGSFVRELSDTTGGGALEITSTANAGTTFGRILDEFRQRYLVAYSPTNVPGSGWHPLTVRVKNRKVDVRARSGYVR